MDKHWTRYGLLGVSVGLLTGGMVSLLDQQYPIPGAMIGSTGLVTFGAWLTIEIHRTFKQPNGDGQDATLGGNSEKGVDDGKSD